MPTTRLQQKGQESTQDTNNQPVNRLPSEILAAIFILCARLCDLSKDEPYGDYACQVAVMGVCRRWRSTAVETTQLWTRVSLPDPTPWFSSALYIARSGNTMLLDINIDMREEFWENTEEGTTEELTQRAQEALAFIVSHGGVTSRWQSVIIITDTFGPHRAVIDFLGSQPLPELRYLQLMFEGPSGFDEGDEDDLYDAAALQPLPLFQHQPSKLNTVKLAGVPNPFLFGQSNSNQLRLPSLTYLELTFAVGYPKLSDFAALLKEISQLEVLRFVCCDIEEEEEEEDFPEHIPRVDLPHLREFALLEVPDPFWPLNFVKMLQAPNVEYLQLDLVDAGDFGGEDDLIGYLVNGGNKAAPQPIFPSINHLSVQLRDLPRTINKMMKALLLAHSQITRLDALFTSLDALTGSPRMVPKLKYLRVTDCKGSEIKRIIAARARAKAPLKVIEYDKHSKRLISPDELEFISSKVEFRLYDSLNEDRVLSGDDTEDDTTEDEGEPEDFDEWEDVSDSG